MASPGDQTPNHADMMLQKVLAKICRDGDKAFMCEEDLRAVWSSLDDIASLFPTYLLGRQDLERIQQRLLRTFSTILYISGDRLVDVFVSQFLSANSGLSDKDMPFSKEDLGFLQLSDRNSFWEKQFIFLPLYIDNNKASGILKCSTERRLPFVNEPRTIGAGGYGEVYMVKIAKRYLRDTARKTSNDFDETVAFKRIGDKDDYTAEIANLDYLRESLRRHEHITMHIAALIHGTTFYIFLPYTEYGSLEVFLAEGLDSSQGTNRQYRKYNFAEHFPSYTTRDLFQQVIFLASALQYLHGGLEMTDSAEAYCAHNDFRTDNILVFPNSKMSAGKWTISDFGISSFNFKHRSIRDVAEKADSRLGQKKFVGAQRAPEVHPDHTLPYSGKKSDVWSLGCILCEVLAFSLGGAALLQEFRSERQNGHDDWFFEECGSQQFRLKRSVIDWLDGIESAHADSPWIDDCTKIVKRILKINPNERPMAREVKDCLAEMRDRHFSTEEPASPPGERGLSRSPTELDSTTSPAIQPLANTPIDVASNSGQGTDLDSNPARPGRQNSSSTFATVASSLLGHTNSGPNMSRQSSNTTSMSSRSNLSPSASSSSQTSSIEPRKLPLHKSCGSQPWNISPSGEHVVYIAKHSKSDSAILVFAIKDICGSQTRSTEIPLPPDIEWREIRIAYPYIGVYGLHRKTRDGKFYSHTLEGGSSLTLDISETWRSQVSSIYPSPSGVFAICTSRYILLRDTSGRVLRSVQTLDVDEASQGYTVHSVTFNSNGSAMFVWARCGSRDDLLFTWSIDPFDPKPAAIYELPTDHFRNARNDTQLILPCGSDPNCIIRLQSGYLYFAEGLASHESRRLDNPRSTFFKAPRAVAATSNSTVLLCKKRKVYVQNIDPPTRSIDSTASEVGTCGLRHINTVQLAVRDEDGKTLVTLGNGDGEIQVIEVA